MALKIIGGSFGLDGSVHINAKDGTMSINSGMARYSADQVKSIEQDRDEKKHISWGSVAAGLLLITPILTFLFNIFGLVGGILLTIAGSSYKTKRRIAHIEFSDGKKLRLSGRDKDFRQFIYYVS